MAAVELQTREAPAKESFAALLDESLGVVASLEGTVVKETADAAERLQISGVKPTGRDCVAHVLPLGVIQILLADLRVRSLISVHHPTPPAKLPDPRILREVADGLRRL